MHAKQMAKMLSKTFENLLYHNYHAAAIINTGMLVGKNPGNMRINWHMTCYLFDIIHTKSHTWNHRDEASIQWHVTLRRRQYSNRSPRGIITTVTRPRDDTDVTTVTRHRDEISLQWHVCAMWYQRNRASMDSLYGKFTYFTICTCAYVRMVTELSCAKRQHSNDRLPLHQMFVLH